MNRNGTPAEAGGAMDVESHLKKFQKELSAGTMALVMLAVLDQAPEPMYGYQIAKHLERSGEGVVAGKQSAFYPVLRNLDAAGLLASSVEPSDAGPPRRYYRITPQGREVLRSWISHWNATRDFVDTTLEGTPR
jgi:PadR family transcriptional regulator PadR